jgi:NADPH:quinone reductase-like Zn-dependent oxidoreductase
MKRIQYHRYGGPEEMRLELCDLPPPARNEILVRVKAASVNPFDWKVRLGTMKFMTGRRLPRAMGSDFSGVAQSVGAGVGTAPFKRQGAFAEQLITEEKRVVRKGWSGSRRPCPLKKRPLCPPSA